MHAGTVPRVDHGRNQRGAENSSEKQNARLGSKCKNTRYGDRVLEENQAYRSSGSALAAMSDPWPSGVPIRWEVLKQAINTCLDDGSNTLADLENVLATSWAASQRSISQDLAEYQAVIAVESSFEETVSFPWQLDVLGQHYEFVPFTSFEALFPGLASEIELQLVFSPVLAPPLFVAMAKTTAASAHLAHGDVMKGFELWRSGLNFMHATSTNTIQMIPTRRAKIHPPRWVVLVSGDAEVSAAYGPDPHGLNSIPVDSTLMRMTSGFVAQFTKDALQSSTLRLLEDGVRLFGMAADQRDWHQALLVLWQLAEHLTAIDGSREKHDEICRRLPLMRLGGDGVEHDHLTAALRDVMGIRHGIVHRGAFGAALDNDVSFLERCCTNSLHWLINRHTDFPDLEQLRAYFQYARATPIQRERVQNVLARLLELG